jgi:TatD DNase family protein
MPPVLVDTHCHLDLEPLAASVDTVLERAREAGVRWCLSIGTTVEASRANVVLARRFSMVRAAVGVHPHEADSVTDATLVQIESLAGEPGVVAVGEVGLDQHRRYTAPASQARVLRGFIAIARRWNLPLLLHCRDAYEPLLDLLRREASGPYRGVIHCASGPPSFIQGALALGFHVSFAGNVTFPSAQPLRELVPLVPDERLLIETDAPFLAPQPVRGQTNEPAHVVHTAARLAELRGMSLDTLAALTCRNASRLFGMPEPRA